MLSTLENVQTSELNAVAASYRRLADRIDEREDAANPTILSNLADIYRDEARRIEGDSVRTKCCRG